MNKRYGILIVSVTILVLGFLGTASATNWSVNGSGGADFTGIQDAINNAKDGDTILVYSGVYYETVVVNKSVTLKGIGHPVVDAGGEENTIGNVVPIEVEEAVSEILRELGVFNAVITLTEDGITLVGFNATKTYRQFDTGIVAMSDNNTIIGNNVYNNYGGICLYYSSNNTITGNNVSNSEEGITLRHSSNNNSIIGNNVSNSEGGIYLEYSNGNLITGNNVCNNDVGFELSSSTSNNKIYFNNAINNTDNVDYVGSTNIWNSTEEITYTYNGTTYKSYVGNYWDNYEGTDADGDGIGNTPYSINSEKEESDDYPLMKPFENYIELVVGEHFL